jgi:hypothetical protein
VGSIAKDEMGFISVDGFFGGNGAKLGGARGFRTIDLLVGWGLGGGLRIEKVRGLEDDAFTEAPITNEGGLRV